ncbi:MAG: hypothetical protein EHM36_05060 [Deltaproteobacteria bacterium]|nr:MAG: hypothetical protein EHM36_05060 [Deltaproteobacteria bacterium]
MKEMAEVKMPHTLHEQHLCLLENVGTNLEEIKKLVKNPQFICKGCGRAAANEKNLCDPEKL